MFRVSEKNKRGRLRRILVRMQGASASAYCGGYVLVDATQQTGQRTSQMLCLFFAAAHISQKATNTVSVAMGGL
jgi:hypothetical protein